jgi:hypothetical protein
MDERVFVVTVMESMGKKWWKRMNKGRAGKMRIALNRLTQLHF